jgi:SAM-dependent methyltransferase
MLDIGCGTKPYADMMRPFVSEHIGVDHADSLHDIQHIDLVGTAYDIPVEAQHFDSVICTSVLEHLEEPEQALRECIRVLKVGGVAIYTIPFIWHVHEEPRDFYRFSRYGIEYLFNKVGFELIELKALSGFWGTFGQLFVYNMYRYNRGPLRWFKVIDVMALLIQSVALILDRLDRTEIWTCMYIVVARKK